MQKEVNQCENLSFLKRTNLRQTAVIVCHTTFAYNSETGLLVITQTIEIEKLDMEITFKKLHVVWQSKTRLLLITREPQLHT